MTSDAPRLTDDAPLADDPRIAIAASPREWAQALHRYVADHGGAIVRATVLQPQDALAEDVDVFVVDDTTSFLSPRLVDALHARGRAVLGVFDPDDPHGKGELLDAGADDVLERGADPEAFVAAVRALAGRTGARAGPEPARANPTVRPEATRRPPGAASRAHGRLVVVAGAAGGVGATEVALGLAAAAGRGGVSVALVDADDVGPAVAQRLGVALYPNIRAALDALQQRGGSPVDALTTVRAGRFALLPGLASGRAWSDVRPGEVLDLVGALTASGRHVVANVGPRIEELPAGPGAAPRYGLTRQLIAHANAVVAVGNPTPVGVARLLEWLADAALLCTASRIHLVVNRAPADRFRRGEIVDELSRSAEVAGITFAPTDQRVTEAAWRGALVTTGPFARAVGAVADAVLVAAPQRRRRRPWWR